MDLVQGELSVQEYTVQFERLSHFAPHLIDAPEKKNKKYVRGLTMSIQGHAMSSITQPFETPSRIGNQPGNHVRESTIATTIWFTTRNVTPLISKKIRNRIL